MKVEKIYITKTELDKWELENLLPDKLKNLLDKTDTIEIGENVNGGWKTIGKIIGDTNYWHYHWN